MTYSKDHPFLASIKERYRLTGPGSKKETWHVVLDLKGSGLRYQVGDCMGIVPVNGPDLVERTLDALSCDGSATVTPQGGECSSLRDFLTQRANITQLTKRLLRICLERRPNPGLESLLDPANRDELRHYLAHHELWDLLQHLPGIRWSPQEICDRLPPLLPRFYSIASSQRVVGDEVHLTMRHTRFTSREVVRQGVCSHFVCHRAPLGQPCIPIYLQPTDSFRLPQDPTTPIIMVGPGTGVAPYRAFLQERLATSADGPHWLFFGEWTEANDFFYQEYWSQLADRGDLHLHTAFSRDQEKKIYVQHRMLEEADALWNWLEQGAHLYVCGDAKQMAKDVDHALNHIISTSGHLSPTEARHYLKNLRVEKRYLRDVY